MIDPNNIINYNRTKAEKEELLMFLVCVAGKNASRIAKQLEKFLQMDSQYIGNLSPFEKVLWMIKRGVLRNYLEQCRMGQYNRIWKAFYQLVNSEMNLDNCTLEDLMRIHGIGRKSASCFLMWTRKGQRVSGLDTHLLKYLREKKKAYNIFDWTEELPKGREIKALLNSVEIPKSTPSSKKVYDALEQAFLLSADVLKKTPEDLDLEIWRSYADK